MIDKLRKKIFWIIQISLSIIIFGIILLLTAFIYRNTITSSTMFMDRLEGRIENKDDKPSELNVEKEEKNLYGVYKVRINNNSIDSKTEDTASTESAQSATLDNSKNFSITFGGKYDLSGEYESVTINTSEEVTLNLTGVTITNSNGPAINVLKAKKVTIVLSGTNKITATVTEDLNGAIYSKADLVFDGTGSLEIKSNYDGIVSKDTLVIKNGTYTINSGDDGIRGKDSVEILDGKFTINAGGDGIKSSNDEDLSVGYIAISGGTFNITAKSDGIQGITKVTITGGTYNITSSEGIEATYIKIDDGTINISASDDGINGSQKSNSGTPTIEINGGNITIKMGQGDTDGIDVNGNLYINGGTINITGNSPFDYDGKAEYNGGTIIVNGEQTNTITNQMMGGGMKGGMPGQMNQGEERQVNGGRRGR